MSNLTAVARVRHTEFPQYTKITESISALW